MSRVIWKGSISFGLVYVPVALYSGEQRDELHFTQLDRRDHSPVGYQRVNKRSGEEVAWEDIVRGYEYEKDEYVLISEEELEQANIEATETVDIVDFVDAGAIPMLYFDKPYYLEPEKKGEKGYVLLRETLKRGGKIGIGRVVLRSRQYVAALVPVGDALVLEILRYAHELRAPEEFRLPEGGLADYGIGDRELKMAQRLVDGMSSPWEPEKYRDEYRDDVMALIEKKVKAGKTELIEQPAKPRERRMAEVVDLMSLLKKSVEESEKKRGKGAEKGKTGKRTRKRA